MGSSGITGFTVETNRIDSITTVNIRKDYSGRLIG